MGAVTPFGCGVETLWRAAAGGACAVRPAPRHATPGDPAPLAAAIPDAVAAEVEAGHGGERCAWAVERVLEEAVASAGLAPGETARLGAGAVYFANHFDADAYEAVARAGGRLRAGDRETWRLDRWARHLGGRSGAVRALGVLTGCTASNVAIGMAYDWIAGGRGAWALAGGMDMLHPQLLIEMESLRALSHSGCRPFSADHDGTVMGDGAGLLLLEEHAAAAARGAPVYAELLGYGEGTVATAPARLDPEGRGAAGALRQALRRAGLEPGDVGYVNASATGSPAVDGVERRALSLVFGDRPPPTSSLKSQMGHSIGGASAIEAILTTRALRHQLLPPTLGLAAGTELSFDPVPEPRAHAFDVALNNAIAMSGHVHATVWKRGTA
jgi:3-oxoacyl-[acyl-carrier-protein] synthase II